MGCKSCIHVKVCVAYQPSETELTCGEFINKDDVAEVARGQWNKSILAQDFFRCSECGAVWNRTFPYCPNCGARMQD